MRLKKMCKNKLAFTLVELVVVIAILGILAAVASVSTIAILNNARKTTAETAASAVKSILETKTVDISKSTKASEIKAWLSEGVKDVTIDDSGTVTGDKPAAASGKQAHIKVGAADSTTIGTTGMKIYVYSQYYYLTMTVDQEGNVTIGSTNKY